MRTVTHRLLEIIEGLIPAILLLGVVLLVCADVGARYLAHAPIRGVSEIALIASVWVVILGSARAARFHQHIAVQALADRFHGRARSAVLLVSTLIVAALAIFILVVSVLYVAKTADRRFPIIGITRLWLTAAIPVGFGLISTHTLHDCVQLLRDLWDGRSRYQELTDSLAAIDDPDAPSGSHADDAQPAAEVVAP